MTMKGVISLLIALQHLVYVVAGAGNFLTNVKNSFDIPILGGTTRPAGVKAPTALEDFNAIAAANFNAWIDALKTKNPSTVASLYVTSELSFLPTVSPYFIRDNVEAEAYFSDFLKKEPTGTITAQQVHSLSADSYLHSGLYTFQLGPARDSVQARFSYVWKRIGGVWKILHHHSSVVPGSDSMSSSQLSSLAEKNFAAWNGALQTGKKEIVAAMYASPMSFLPTLSESHIKTTEGALEYFASFLLKKPYGKITDEEIIATSSSSYVHSGLYTFELGDATARSKVDARFSYLWKKVGDEWKIFHHHSSLKPGTEDSVEAEALMPTVEETFEEWSEALSSGDKEKIAGLYARDDLTFLPTLEAKMLTSRPETLAYFEELLKKNPSVKLDQEKVHACGKNGFLHSGTYTFSTSDGPVPARFSYFWKKGKDGKYKIQHHHSSKLPDP